MKGPAVPTNKLGLVCTGSNLKNGGEWE
jgi:hypothetical protein